MKIGKSNRTTKIDWTGTGSWDWRFQNQIQWFREGNTFWIVDTVTRTEYKYQYTQIQDLSGNTFETADDAAVHILESLALTFFATNPTVDTVENVVATPDYYGIQFTWDVKAGATTYKVLIKDTGRTAETTYTTATNSLFIGRLEASTSYTYQVAYSTGGSFSDYTASATSSTTAKGDSGHTYSTGTTYQVATGTSVAAAQAIIDAASSGDNILFQRGGEWYGGFDIPGGLNIGAYQSGQTPCIYGSQDLTESSWTLDSGNVYYLDISGISSGQLIVDGAIVFPCSSALQTIEGGSDTSLIDTSFLNTGNYVGAQVTFKGDRWAGETRTILTHTTGTGTITWAANGQYPNGLSSNKAGYGYKIFNHPDFMTEAGDWWYDESAGRLYYQTAGGAPSGDIRAISTGAGLTINGDGVSVRDLDIQYFDDGIFGYDRDTLTVEYNTIKNCWNCGVYLDNPSVNASYAGTTGHEMNHNSISYCSGGGIVGWNCLDSNFRYNQISQIANVHWGRLKGLNGEDGAANNQFNSGIATKSGMRCNFEYNVIDYCGQSGIKTEGGSHNILNNHISHTGTMYGDLGAIYTQGFASYYTTTNCTISFNVIEFVYGNHEAANTASKTLANGIYCDNGSVNFTIEGNVIREADWIGMLLNRNNTGHTVRNNYIYHFGDQPTNTEKGRAVQITNGNGTQAYHTFEENVICLNDNLGTCIMIKNEANTASYNPFTSIANNTYIVPYQSKVAKHEDAPEGDTEYDYSSFISWTRETGSIDHTNKFSFIDRDTAKLETILFDNPTAVADDGTWNSGTFIDINSASVTSPVSVPKYSAKFIIKYVEPIVAPAFHTVSGFAWHLPANVREDWPSFINDLPDPVYARNNTTTYNVVTSGGANSADPGYLKGVNNSSVLTLTSSGLGNPGTGALTYFIGGYFPSFNNSRNSLHFTSGDLIRVNSGNIKISSVGNANFSGNNTTNTKYFFRITRTAAGVVSVARTTDGITWEAGSSTVTGWTADLQGYSSFNLGLNVRYYDWVMYHTELTGADLTTVQGLIKTAYFD